MNNVIRVNSIVDPGTDGILVILGEITSLNVYTLKYYKSFFKTSIRESLI